MAQDYSSAAELIRMPLREADEAAETETSASMAPVQAARVGQAATAPQLKTTDSPYQVDGMVASSTQRPSTGGSSAAEAQTATSSVDAGGSSGHCTMGSPPPPGGVVVNSPEPVRSTIPAAAMSEGIAQRSSRGGFPPVQAGSQTVPTRARSTTPTRSLTPPRTCRPSSVAPGQATQHGQGEATAEATSTLEAFAAADTLVQPPGGMILPPIALATADDNVVTVGTGGEQTTAGGSISHHTDPSTGGINRVEAAESSFGSAGDALQ